MDYIHPGLNLLGLISFSGDYITKAKRGEFPYRRDTLLIDEIDGRESGITIPLLEEIGQHDGPFDWYELPVYPVPGKAGLTEEDDKRDWVTGVVGLQDERVAFVESFDVSGEGFLIREFVAAKEFRRARLEFDTGPHNVLQHGRRIRWTAQIVELDDQVKIDYDVVERVLHGTHGIRCERVRKYLVTARRIERLVAASAPQVVLDAENELLAERAADCAEAFQDSTPPPLGTEFDQRLRNWLRSHAVPSNDVELIIAQKPVPSAYRMSEWSAELTNDQFGELTLKHHDAEAALLPPNEEAQQHKFTSEMATLSLAATRICRITLPALKRCALSYDQSMRW